MSTTIDFAERLKTTRSRNARSQSVATRFTENEQNELIKAAEAAGQTLREWLRETALREARRSQTDPVWTEIVSTRMLLLAVLRPLATGQKMTIERFDELVAAIKKGKRSMAEEVMQQYKSSTPKEPAQRN